MADHIKKLLSQLPDRQAALLYAQSLSKADAISIRDNAVTKINSDSRLLYVWQVLQIRLREAARNPTQTFVDPTLSKWNLSYLLAAGGVQKMQVRLRQLIEEDAIEPSTFAKLLILNIEAARKKQYAIKVEILTIILSKIKQHYYSMKHDTTATKETLPPAAPSTSTMKSKRSAAIPPSAKNVQHAPVFLTNTTTNTTNTSTGSNSSLANLAEGNACLVKNCSNVWRSKKVTGKCGKKNNRKKFRKKEKASLLRTAGCLVESLEQHEFAAIDEFADANEVAKIREEVCRLAPYTKPSQIWVGKESGVGAHVTLPKVRGDKVLWMCGGHGKKDMESNLFDSAGVQPTTINEIEPCDPIVRAATSFDGRFVHLRNILQRLDKLVYEGIRVKSSRLKGISSRSDCMLAKYTVGDRFQKHIDNTAQDGRKLTCLVYLNEPSSTPKSVVGGEIRLHNCGSGTKRTVDLCPIGGRLVLFYSDSVTHEVLEQLVGDRWAITIWYYDFGERLAAVMKAQTDKIGVEEDVNSSDSQREAQTFVLQLLEDNVTVDNESGLSQLKKAAKSLSVAALQILGRVFFGKSVPIAESNHKEQSSDDITAETIRLSLLALSVEQYVELRTQARQMHTGK